MDVSRSYQERLTAKGGVISETITDALKNTPPIFPKHGTVACQGVEGAYSQLACDKLFTAPSISYFKNFEGVFAAVEQGLCEYGILPIENSTYGTVNEVYDLMKNYRFHIVRSIKLKVDHSLLVLPGTELKDVKEIFSHEQAIGQCSEFLKAHSGIKVTVCDNTAAAAKMLHESGRHDAASISSAGCANLYGLKKLDTRVQNTDGNFTRFICISKKAMIFPGADRISLMLSLPHRPGSLYSLISKFSVLGLNLTKLESRPIAGSDFEFMFYFDIEASVYSPAVLALLDELSDSPELFVFLGSYSKLIHEAFGLYSYELVSLPKDKVGEFMENEEFDAFNVTIPYKRTVMPYCSYISPEAQKIGSVNTVVRTSDGLHGFNTDYFGFKSMAERAGIDFAGKKVVILGSGGTSLTARAVASDGGAERITVVSRSGEYNYDNLEKLADCEVLINTTPVGMYPNNGSSAASLDKFPRCEAVLDVIYNPLRTQLIMQALERGIKCSGGLYMLVAQAAQSAKYFCSAEIGKEEIERVFRSLALDVQNIVLVGMPGCGKTTVAEELSKLTGRKAVDTDSLVEESAGMSVPEIFSQYGEKRFRELEAQAVRSAAKEKGLIIATGGGAVLDPGNVRALKGNGRIYYLKRDLNLLSLDGRPLSKSRETLDKMFKARDPIYSNCADAAINNDLSPVLTAQRIKDELDSSDI